LSVWARRFDLECLVVYPDDISARDYGKRTSTLHWRWQALDDQGNRYRLRAMNAHSPESLRLAHAEWVFEPGLDDLAQEVAFELTREGVDESLRFVVPLA
jgi:hypothetical protein